MKLDRLRDGSGNLIGTIETKNDGRQIIKDKSGRMKGEYTPSNNITRSVDGKRIGQAGNFLTNLL